MEHQWRFAPGLGADLEAALRQALRPDALRPFQGGTVRAIRGRRRAVLPAGGGLPFPVFVKAFDHDSLGRRIKHRLGLAGPSREFANAIRLYGTGAAAVRPLAQVDERDARGDRRTYLLTVFHEGARPLRAFLTGPPPDDEAVRAVAADLGAVLVGLAARRIVHRDFTADNLLILPGAGGRPGGVVLVDLRHVDFRCRPGRAAADMLLALAGSLYAAGVAPCRIAAVVEEGIRLARERGVLGPRITPAEVLHQGRHWGRRLAARHARKGGGGPALDAFARCYGDHEEAVRYRDQRFARSRRGRTIERAERAWVERLLGRLDLRGPVLDVPCGAGRFLPILGSRGVGVVGADVSEAMLRLACQPADQSGAAGPALRGPLRRADRRARPAVAVRADVRRLPFADGAFDLVFVMRLLHRVPQSEERLAVLREAARVSGRWVLFSFYDSLTPYGLWASLRGRHPGRTRRLVGREVRAAGMRVERFVRVSPLARQTLVLCRIR